MANHYAFNKFRKWLVLLLLLFLGGALALFYITDPLGRRSGEVSINCVYLGCAACSADYHVYSVSDPQYKKIVSKEIAVDFHTHHLDSIKAMIDSCPTCYNYFITGFLRYNVFKTYYTLEATRCQYQRILPN